MKKLVLSGLLLFLAAAGGRVAAQNRLSLYEEFTGEQCIECAILNPGLQTLLAANTKVLHITYPVPFPAAGPLYTVYPAISNARAAYYGVTSAPQGRLDGTYLGTGTASSVPGHIANLTQSDLNVAPAVSTPFSLNVSHSWSVTGDTVTATITIQTPNAYTAPTGAALKLRLALVEHIHTSPAPGINAEQDFPNVVRDMYPSAAGTTLPLTWTMGQTATYTITNRVGRYFDKSNVNFVAWIQDDAGRNILQAAPSTPLPIALDAATIGTRPSARLQCVSANATVNAYATLRNAGTATLTSARIWYHTDVSSLLQFVNWSGSLAPGAVTLVSLGAISLPGGNHSITDSVVLPNGAIDINPGNGTGTGSVAVYTTTPANLPIVTGFETAAGTIPAGWILYDADSNGRNFTVSKNIFGPAAGYGGSTWFLLHNNYYVAAGETNYAILPAAKIGSGVMLSFAYAHAQYSTENDKLEVVYSTDCGASWTSLWSAAGANLSTAPATTDYFVPTASQWAGQSVDVSSVPAGALLALRATSDYGNALYIDNVRLEVPAGIATANTLSGISVAPNPAKNAAELSFVLAKGTDIHITLTDAIGRSFKDVASRAFDAGTGRIVIETSALPAGLYYLRLQTGDGNYSAKALEVIR